MPPRTQLPKSHSENGPLKKGSDLKKTVWSYNDRREGILVVHFKNRQINFSLYYTGMENFFIGDPKFTKGVIVDKGRFVCTRARRLHENSATTHFTFARVRL